jgi:hypothetical protein
VKDIKNKKRIILNHELCRIVEDQGKVTLYIRMADGKFAVQRPYDGDLRGLIGAMTLAIDVLAGKIMLGTVAVLDASEFESEINKIESIKQIK